jgi:hypothetical protein
MVRNSNHAACYARWLARGLSIVAAGMVVLIFVGEGRIDLLRASPHEAALFVLFFISWLGLVVAWRWEVLGAAMTLGGMGLFYVVHYVDAGKWPRGWAFAFIASPGFFFFCSSVSDWWRRRQLNRQAAECPIEDTYR